MDNLPGRQLRVVSTYLPMITSRGMSRIGAVTAISLALVSLAACARTHPEYLAALNGDPLANITLSDATLEERTEVDASEGGFMDSKRTNAAVLQVLRIDDAASPEDVLASAGEIAQEERLDHRLDSRERHHRTQDARNGTGGVGDRIHA